MKTKYVESKRITEIHDGKDFQLEYLLVKEWGANNDEEPYYGIRIVKKEDDLIEVENSGGITYSMDSALRLLVKLSNNTVTPIVMLEVIDELYYSDIRECIA